MPVPSFDDPREFMDDFAVRVTVTPKKGAGSSTDVMGIFDEKYEGAKLGEYEMQTSPNPRLRCIAEDVAGLKKYDPAVVHDDVRRTSVAYYLEHDPSPDGHGFAILHLARDTDG